MFVIHTLLVVLAEKGKTVNNGAALNGRLCYP
jgi:hypothetical protein